MEEMVKKAEMKKEKEIEALKASHQGLLQEL